MCPPRPDRRVTRSDAVALDGACAEAVDLARAAAVEEAGPDGVGEHLGRRRRRRAGRDPPLRLALAAATSAGRGRSRSPAPRAPRRSPSTRSCLLPGAGALLAPAVGAVRRAAAARRPRPRRPAARATPTTTGSSPAGPAASRRWPTTARPTTRWRELAWELGLGRARVLSLIGIDDAADRWVNGAGGPHTPLAEAAPAPCVHLRLPGPARRAAGPGVRRLRQRVLAERRPRRHARPRLRRAQRGRGGARRWPRRRRCWTRSGTTSCPSTVTSRRSTPGRRTLLDDAVRARASRRTSSDEADAARRQDVPDIDDGLRRRRRWWRSSSPWTSPTRSTSTSRPTPRPRARLSPRGGRRSTRSARPRCAGRCSTAGRLARAVPRGRQRRGGLRARRVPRPAGRRARAERRRRGRPGRRSRPAAADARRPAPVGWGWWRRTPERRWTPPASRRCRPCGLGQARRRRGGRVGRFGVGFAAVLDVTDEPALLSTHRRRAAGAAAVRRAAVAAGARRSPTS